MKPLLGTARTAGPESFLLSTETYCLQGAVKQKRTIQGQSRNAMFDVIPGEADCRTKTTADLLKQKITKSRDKWLEGRMRCPGHKKTELQVDLENI